MSAYGRLTGMPHPRFTDRNGKPCAGWRLRWLWARTSDLAAVWGDIYAQIPQANPTVLNFDGTLPNGGDIFGETGRLYDMQALRPDGAAEWTSYDISPAGYGAAIIPPGSG